jgi:hypothetical protein
MQDIDDQNLPVNLLGAGGVHQPCRFIFSLKSSVLSALGLLIIETDSGLSDCSIVVFTVSAKARPFLLPDDAAS